MCNKSKQVQAVLRAPSIEAYAILAQARSGLRISIRTLPLSIFSGTVRAPNLAAVPIFTASVWIRMLTMLPPLIRIDQRKNTFLLFSEETSAE